MFTSKPAVERLQEKSKKIVNIFSETVRDLTAVNDEILAEEDAKVQIILQENLELSKLQTQREQNEKLISKITDFLN